MDHATQVGLMQRVFALLDRNSTELGSAPYVNSVASYTCAEQFARERMLLFRRQPILLGLSGDAPEPGAYFTHSETDVPVLVVRAQGGSLHAFLNVCRHRGAPVAAGGGRGPGRFTCPYHGWTYDECGRLVAQPCREGFDTVPLETLGLTALPVAERSGMIFVQPTPDEAIDVEAHLGGAEREIEALGLQRYAPFARHESLQPMNWKLVIDTFLEAYHVPSLHRRTLGPSIHGGAAVWDAFGRCGRMIAARHSITAARQRPQAEWNLLEHAVVLYQLFPNTMLIHQIDHIEIVQAYPGSGGPDTAIVVFSLYTPGPVTDERARRHFQTNFDLLLQVTEREDFQLGAQIQRGFHAGGPGTVIYGRNEPGLAHYHRNVRLALGLDAPNAG